MNLNPNYPATVRRVGRIIAALTVQPMNFHELAVATSTAESTLTKYIRLIHKAMPQEQRQVHVARWVPYGVYGRFIAVYAAGNRKDARKPAPLTLAQRNARYFKRRQKDEERHEMWLATRRARDWANRAKGKPTTWLSALEGK